MSFLDNAISTGVKMAVNHMLDDIGKLSEFHIDRQAKTMAGTVLLDGEDLPVDFRVGHYEFSKSGEDVFIKLRDVKCSRQWLQKAIVKFQPEPVVKLPEKLAQAVKFAGMA